MPDNKPSNKLLLLGPLIGVWDIKGRTPDSDKDNITGQVTIEWLPGGHLMQQRGKYSFDDTAIESLEIIAYDPESDSFPSYVYSNIDSMPLPYGWGIEGKTLYHWDATSKYTGKISDDGNTIAGGWRPKDEQNSRPGETYDAIMIRKR